jgi:hypothetical protein
LDPLKPFTNLIRSLGIGKRPAVREPGSATARRVEGTNADAQPVASSGPVSARLQSRLAALQQWDGDTARQVFVEHILLVELGEGLARDPAFGDLVQRVSAQLGSEPTVRARLDQLLRELAAGKTVT